MFAHYWTVAVCSGLAMLSRAAADTATTSSSSSVWDVLSSHNDFSLFRLGLENANLTNLLQTQGSLVDASSSTSSPGFTSGIALMEQMQAQWQDLTIFAPSNQAFAMTASGSSSATSRDLFLLYFLYNSKSSVWSRHLEELLLNQIVNVDRFTTEELWNGNAGGTLRTVAGQALSVDTQRQEIQGVSLLNKTKSINLMASNGIVHGTSAVFAPDWIQQTIRQVLTAQEQEESFAFLVQSLDQATTAAQDENKEASLLLLDLDRAVDTGTTLIAPRNTADFFTTTDGGGNVTTSVSKQTDVDSAAATAGNDKPTRLLSDQDLLYHMIDTNVLANNHVDEVVYDYNTGVSYMQPWILTTRHPTAKQIIASVVTHPYDGSVQLKYNNVLVDKEYVGNNGLIHSAGQALRPPGMVEMLRYYSEGHLVGAMFQQSGWNLQDLSKEEELQEYLQSDKGDSGQGFTIFCPMHYYDDYSFAQLYSTPAFSRHLKATLMKGIIPGVYTVEDLHQLQLQSESSYDTIELETVGGDAFPLYTPSLLSSGEVISLHGVDGIMHMLASVSSDLFLLPRFEDHPDTDDSHYYNDNQIGSVDVYSLFMSLMTASTNHDIDYNDGITVFAPPIDAWKPKGNLYPSLIPHQSDSSNVSNDDIYYSSGNDENYPTDLLQNHAFKGLYFVEDLLEMDGELITSVNGKRWIVSVLDGNIFLSSYKAAADEEGDAASDFESPVIQVLTEGGQSNNLTRTGVLRRADGVLLDREAFVSERKAAELCPSQDRAFRDCFSQECVSGFVSAMCPDDSAESAIETVIFWALYKDAHSCASIGNLLCDHYRGQEGRSCCIASTCSHEMQSLASCAVANTIGKADLASCDTGEMANCPTIAPTPMPNPYPTVLNTDGDRAENHNNDNTKDASDNSEDTYNRGGVIAGAVFGVILIGCVSVCAYNFCIAPCMKRFWLWLKQKYARDEEETAENKSAEDEDEEEMVIAFVDEDEKVTPY